MSQRLAIFPGSFDPMTNGHVGILRRGLRLFDRVIVAVTINVRKTPLFTPQERMDMATTVDRGSSDQAGLGVTPMQDHAADPGAAAGAVHATDRS